MIPGDGVGPELCESVKMVISAAGIPVEWNEIAVRLLHRTCYYKYKYDTA